MYVPLPDCCISYITLIDAELHGKGSTGCGNFHSSSKINKLHIDEVMLLEARGSLILEHHVDVAKSTCKQHVLFRGRHV